MSGDDAPSTAHPPRAGVERRAAHRESPARRTLGDASLALSFLTLLPLPERAFKGGEMRRAAGWFPLVGLLLGAFAGAVRSGADSLFGIGPASVLALIALVVATGALHQDGLADCADGLGVRGDRERRLAVMRDSAIGTFGMLALLGWGLLTLTVLTQLPNVEALAALIAAAALGRAAALVHAVAAPPARRDGLGAAFTVPRAALAAGVATAAVVTALATAAIADRGLADAALALAAAAAAAALVTAWARRAVGGRTGDTLGATVAIVEVAVLLALAAAWG